MKKIISIILIISLVCLVNCSQESTTPSYDEGVKIPEILTFTEPTKGLNLSEAQINDLKTHLGQKTAVTPPNLDLFFATNAANNEVKHQEASLQAKDNNSYEFLKDVQKNCNKQNPKVKTYYSFPTDQRTSFERLQNGDNANLEYYSSLEGSNCPVKMNLSYQLQGLASDIVPADKAGQVQVNAEQSGQAILLSPKYAKLFNSKGLVLSSGVSALNIRQDIKNSYLIKYNLKGSYMSLSENFPFDGQVTTLVHANTKSPQKWDTIVKFIFHIKRTPIIIDIHQWGGDTASSKLTKYYVNGHKTEESEFKSIFGTHNPVFNLEKIIADIIN